MCKQSLLAFAALLIRLTTDGITVEQNPLCNFGESRGRCVSEDQCQKPNQERFACPVVYCPQVRGKPTQVCCFTKKNKPPKKQCFPPALKPGQCPQVPDDAVGTCIDRCQTDADCIGIRKCCSNGCGHICRLPTTVTCEYRESGGQEFIGECLPASLCGRGRVSCPGFRCREPYQDSLCCFKKKNRPDKKTCENGPMRVIKCFITGTGATYEGECRPASQCQKPNKLRVPCSRFPRCPTGQVCCFTKKGRPPAQLC